MNSIEIFGFETSNNMKVRIALEYKDLPYTFSSIDPADRGQVMEMTGQPLTPVMRHGAVVLFDSSAILRYLDANFPAAPRLFSGDRQTVVAIEDWETFGRSRLLGPMIVVVNRRLQGKLTDETFAAARDDYRRAIARLEAGLSDAKWLVGSRMTGADVTVAPVVFRGTAIGFIERDDLQPGTLAWVDRVMSYDSPAG